MTTYAVTYHDPQTGADSPVGTVGCGMLGELTVLSAAPDRAEFLRELVGRLNQQAALHVRVPPPPGAQRFALYSRRVERTDPGFRAALQEFLETYYRLTLTAAGPEDPVRATVPPPAAPPPPG